jgi:hypothetical protein
MLKAFAEVGKLAYAPGMGAMRSTGTLPGRVPDRETMAHRGTRRLIGAANFYTAADRMAGTASVSGMCRSTHCRQSGLPGQTNLLHKSMKNFHRLPGQGAGTRPAPGGNVVQ